MKTQYAPYALIATIGESPQVLTELVWNLAREHHPAMIPEVVHVITTRTGRIAVDSQLLGKQRIEPGKVWVGKERWRQLFAELGVSEPPEISFDVPRVDGDHIDDVRSRFDDLAVASAAFARVRELAQNADLPIVGLLSGGRKTMSARLQEAFSWFGRPTDRLCHVLIEPEDLETAASFFWPGEPAYLDDDERGVHVRITRCDVRFLPMRGVKLADPAVRPSEFPDSWDELERELGRYNMLDTPVANVTVRINARSSHGVEIVVEMEDGYVTNTMLTGKAAVDFLVLCDLLDICRVARERRTVRVARSQLETTETEEVRGAVADVLNATIDAPWGISNARNVLNKALRVPIISRYFGILGSRELGGTHYGWKAELSTVPAFVIDYTFDLPFKHIMLESEP